MTRESAEASSQGSTEKQGWMIIDICRVSARTHCDTHTQRRTHAPRILTHAHTLFKPKYEMTITTQKAT